MKRWMGLPLAVAAVVIAPQFAAAHFKLLAPDSAIVENDLGDPQKLGPCGGNSAKAKGGENPGTPTNAVTKVAGGSMLKIRVRETVFHPGHYRIALSVNSRAELPADPAVTTKEGPRGEMSVSAVIQKQLAPPVLVDGLWPHTEKLTNELETEVALPNINCTKCTLQVIQFMAEHGRNVDGDFSYHHCADLQITADPAKPIDTRWPGQKK